MDSRERNLLLLVVFVFLILAGLIVTQSNDVPENDNRDPVPENTDGLDTDTPVENNSGNPVSEPDTRPAVIAESLEVPWGIEFLPNNDTLVTERPGNLLRIEEGEGRQTEIYEVEGVAHRGEGGLLGIAAHPNYTENNWIYLYMTTREGNMLQNRVVRYELNDDQLSDPEVIIDGLPGAQYHDGGRIDFGPDEKLYITAGDATNEQWAQDTEILAGKILRINPDGSIPEDNPFGNEVYSYGHRNPQGLAWINDQLWATEHGDVQNDELNRIDRERNYGWPVIEGDEEQEGMQQPEIHSGDTTWAPAGAAYVNDSIFFAGLRSQTLYEAEIEDGEVTELKQHLEGDYGRLRAVELGPDDYLYVSTSNTDGRGNPTVSEDRILRIDPDSLDS